MLNWTHQLRATRRGVKRKSGTEKSHLERVSGQERSRTCRAEKKHKRTKKINQQHRDTESQSIPTLINNCMEIKI